MSYPYSQVNRLDEPHNYMYTKFQGVALLQSYQSSRMAVLCRRSAPGHCGIDPDYTLLCYAFPVLGKLLDTTSLELGNRFRLLTEGMGRGLVVQGKPDGEILEKLADGLALHATTESISTLSLLHSLIAVQLLNLQEGNTKDWLDRLVQRFEVTKKVYESYPPGFRKGEGTNTAVRLYWLFSLALSLFYARSNEIKYLSTLLKVCDLLCSLPENILVENIPDHGLAAVLAAEIAGVQQLAEKQRVAI